MFFSRIVLLPLDSSFLVGASTTDYIFAPSAELVIHMIAVVNQTSPMDLSQQPLFSTVWSLSMDALLDEIFTAETRYTFYKREKTIISITLVDQVYYVSNVQQPIARQSEIVFRTLLFTTVVLELSRLGLLVAKLIFIPIFRIGVTRLSKKGGKVDSTVDESSHTEAHDTELKSVSVNEGKFILTLCREFVSSNYCLLEQVTAF